MNLQLYVDDGSPSGITLDSHSQTDEQARAQASFRSARRADSCPVLWQCPSNVPFNASTMQWSLILAPAERADLIVDFEGSRARS